MSYTFNLSYSEGALWEASFFLIYCIFIRCIEAYCKAKSFPFVFKWPDQWSSPRNGNVIGCFGNLSLNQYPESGSALSPGSSVKVIATPSLAWPNKANYQELVSGLGSRYAEDQGVLYVTCSAFTSHWLLQPLFAEKMAQCSIIDTNERGEDGHRNLSRWQV